MLLVRGVAATNYFVVMLSGQPLLTSTASGSEAEAGLTETEPDQVQTNHALPAN
jgi:hypothetical protein